VQPGAGDQGVRVRHTPRPGGWLLAPASQVLLTGGAQVVVQVLGLLAGIAVVRFLSPLQYAAYTVTNATIGALIAIADSGVAAGVLASGGRVWADREGLGRVIVTAQAVRSRVLPTVLVAAVCLVVWVTMRLGLRLSEATLLSCSVLPLVWATTRTQILEVVPRLRQDLRSLQSLQVLNNAGRLLMVCATVPVLPFAAIAIGGAAVPQAWLAWRLRRRASLHANLDAAVDETTRHALQTQVRRTMPAAIYFALSGQLAIGLVSFLGTAHQVASVGALGRVSMVLVALNSAFAVLVVPRFARLLDDDPARVRRWYWLAQALLLSACLFLVVIVGAFRDQVLWVLGPSYAELGREVVLMAGSGVVWTMAGGALALASARAVVTPYWLLIPTSLLVEVIAIITLPVGTVVGAILLSSATALTQWSLYSGYFHWRMGRRPAARVGA
jgi:hypothetical protein